MSDTELINEEEEQRVVNMADLAPRIEEYLTGNLQATVDEIAEEFDLVTDEVVAILSMYRREEDGSFTLVPYGQGGGWAPARAAEIERRQRVVALLDEQIAERKQILDLIPEDANEERQQMRTNLTTMIDTLEEQRKEYADE